MTEGIIHRVADFSLLPFVFTFAAMWTLLIVVEAMKRAGAIHGEIARKAIHIGSGLIIATTPLYMEREEIIILNLFFLAGLLVFAGALHTFTALHDVRRWTIGEFIYPVGVAFTAYFFGATAVFSFAVLILAFADGLAALFGRRFGERHYHVFGGDKTYLGSAVFFVTAFVLLCTFALLDGNISLMVFGLVAVAALAVTISEALISAGMDNLTIPLLAGVFLSIL